MGERTSLAVWIVGVASAVWLAGCERSPIERQCEQMTERYEACSEDVEIPPAARLSMLSSMSLVCNSWMQPLEPPPDGRPSLAHIFQDALRPCLSVTDCEALQSCLDEGGCRFILEHPGDTTPEFTCFGPD